MTRRQPRDYQERLIREVQQALGKAPSVLAAMPTGAGKTVTFAEIIARALDKQRRAAVIVHRQELISQSEAAIAAQTGAEPGIVWESRRQWEQPCTVISHGTIAAGGKPEGYRPHLLLLDEAHHAAAAGWRKAIRMLQPDYLIGFTATPFRQDREPLHPEPFANVISPITPKELIDRGILCPARIISPLVTDPEGAPQPPSAAANLTALYGQAVQYALAQGRRKIILFVSGTRGQTPSSVIDSAAQALNRAGITAAAISQESGSRERSSAIARFRATPAPAVLCNYMTLTEGFDAPETDCVIIGRATKSESTIIQMIGRGLRRHPGKADCLVLDYTGRLDMDDIIHYWRLDGPKGESEVREPKAKQPPLPELHRMTASFGDALGGMERTRARYPWFKPWPERPLLALRIRSRDANASDAYLAIEPESADAWRLTILTLHRAGPTPLSRRQKRGLTQEDAATQVRMALGPDAPTLQRNAGWRLQAATERQTDAWRRIIGDDPPPDLTSGEASDVISQERFRNRINPAIL